MARPIRPTPKITGKDAEELLKSLEEVAPQEEIRRRRELARARLKQVTTPLSERKKAAPKEGA